MRKRAIDQIVTPIETSDGAGVRIKRAIGTQTLDRLDPFLLLDLFGSDKGADYIAGFPDHPHRGFETVTYMLHGKMGHGDHMGNKGLLESGGAQWMTAGKGIIHSEMPEQTDGLMKGFQIWVNLPASHKMIAPRYQDLAPEEIPTQTLDGVGTLKVIAGTAFETTGPVSEIITNPLFIDLALDPMATIDIPIPQGQTAFAFVFEGSIKVDNAEVNTNKLVIFEDGDVISVEAGKEGGRFILLAADPINEPVARYGPFVMNTREELYQAFEDFQNGRF